MATGRRIARKRRIAGRVWNDAQRDLQDLLDELCESNDDGIPPGFNASNPTTITPDDAASPGTQASGWAAANHTHAIATAAPSNPTGTAAAEGTGTSFMRADATIQQGIVTTKGDLLGRSTVPERVPIGSDTYVLMADAAQALGLKWSPSRLRTRVASNFNKTDTTLATVTGLSVTVVAGRTYRFRAVLFVDADVTGGSKFAIAGTATATAIIYHIRLLDDTTDAYTIAARQTALGGASGQAGTTAGLAIIEGLITVNAGGTLLVQFAQNAANATSTVLAGSTFVVEDTET